MPFVKNQVPESMAIAAIFAAGLTLNSAWIINFLANRVVAVAQWLSFDQDVGPVSGMFFVSAIIYLVSCSLMIFWYRNRDCSHQREAVYWFLIISIIIFALMTIPGIFDFRIQ